MLSGFFKVQYDMGIVGESKVLEITKEQQEEIVKGLKVTEKQVRKICNFPQRTPEWHEARKHRITGSRIGSAIGMNRYQTEDQLLSEMFWPCFKGNPATQRGTRMEKFAAESILRITRRKTGNPKIQLAIPGLIVCQKEPIFAYSPDGVIIFPNGERLLLEIKAPFNRKPYPKVPPSYYCQVQLGMYVMNLDHTIFVMYCGEGVVGDDSQTHILKIKRNEDFIQNILLPKARKFFQRYTLLSICFDRGLLKTGQVYLPRGVKVSQP
jgi:putative phage-type endonuclease